VRVSSFDASGKFVYSISFEYTMNGLVSRTQKNMADGTVESCSYRYGGGTVMSSWADSPSDGIRWTYDQASRLVKTEEWRDGKILRSSTQTYASPDNSVLVSRELVDNVASTRHLEVFDDKSRVIQIDDSKDGNLASRTIQSWDDQDELLSRRIVSGDQDESWTYEYKDGSLSVERYAKNDQPVRVVTYQGTERVEELYLNGKALLRVYYRGNQRYKEEELRDGLVVRTRDYAQ